MSNADLIRRLRALAFDPDGVPGHLIDEAADALAAHEWSTDMDAAPRDGTVIIVPGGIAYWRHDQHGDWYTITGEEWPGKPIQWEVKCWKPFPGAPPDNRTGKE